MKGFLPWLGGKHYLAKKIVPLIEAQPHVCYVEPFMGAAHVFFRREPAKVEVLNDLNSELVTLFRVLQHHLEEFLRQFEWSVVSREDFQRWDKTPPESLTDIQRAARFYTLQKMSFAGRNWSRAFRTKTNGPPQLNLVRMTEELREVRQRLARVQIEHLPWADCIARYDREHTFFYLDPPYYGVEDYYGKAMFKREEYQQMVDVLANLRGSFLLSLNDRPEVREIFKRFHITEISHRYPTGNHSDEHQEEVNELLISPEPLSL